MKRLACVLVLAWVAAAGASTLKLPEGIALPKSSDSPGQVTFYHETHVDSEKPSCTTCHPRHFRILKTTKRQAITHERFDKGEACAACHDGKKAFAIDADCSFCHQS